MKNNEFLNRYNIFSILAASLILLNCVLEIYSYASLSTILNMQFDFDFYRALIVYFLIFGSVISSIGILLEKKIFLKLSLAIYLIQIFGFVNGDVYYILSHGLWISSSTEIASSSIEINLVAIFISVVIFMAIKSKKNDA